MDYNYYRNFPIQVQIYPVNENFGKQYNKYKYYSIDIGSLENSK